MEAFAGRYQLIDLVGTGGMGSVWRAWDLRREAYVAAKVLGQHDAATLLRFVREQSLRIDHPHVVAPHGWAADDDKVVFAMDLVRGGSVATLLGDHGPLPVSYVAVLLDQLLHGLSAVHAAGIVHRDLKPANLLLDATGTTRPHLRLSDFGIAGLIDEPRMTRHSTVLGTPGYLAPEQLAGADPDPRQDLYTVGAVAAELLTGVRPKTTGELPQPPAPHHSENRLTSPNANSENRHAPPNANPENHHAVPNANSENHHAVPNANSEDRNASPNARSEDHDGSPDPHQSEDRGDPGEAALWDLIHHLTSANPTDRPATALEAGRLLAATGTVPPPPTTPWTLQPDPPEVFDQLPPLPPNWHPTQATTSLAGAAGTSPALTNRGAAAPTGATPVSGTQLSERHPEHSPNPNRNESPAPAANGTAASTSSADETKRSRLLVWLAAGSFVGAAVLLGAAVWLLVH